MSLRSQCRVPNVGADGPWFHVDLRIQELIETTESAKKPRSNAELWKMVYSDNWWNWKDKMERTMRYLGNPSYEENGLGFMLAALKIHA